MGRCVVYDRAGAWPVWTVRPVWPAAGVWFILTPVSIGGDSRELLKTVKTHIENYTWRNAEINSELTTTQRCLHTVTIVARRTARRQEFLLGTVVKIDYHQRTYFYSLLRIQLNTSFHLLYPSPDFISFCVILTLFSSPSIPFICKILKLPIRNSFPWPKRYPNHNPTCNVRR